MPLNLGNVIRERRMDLGLTQEDLANRIEGGIRQAQISRLESGLVMLPRRDRLRNIAHALGMTLGELLEQAGWDGAHAAFSDEEASASAGKEQHGAHSSQVASGASSGSAGRPSLSS